jgi:hypothetical protein
MICRIVLFFLCAISLLGCGSFGHSKMPISEKDKSQTVVLMERIDDEMHTYCTGVWINSSTILTARHCIAGAVQTRFIAAIPTVEKRIEAIELDMVPHPSDSQMRGFVIHYTNEANTTLIGENPLKMFSGKVIGCDKIHDLAVILVTEDKPDHQTASLVSELPIAGTEVSIVGHPKGFTYTTMKGTISGVREEIPSDYISGPFVQIVAPVWMGNSGGGAFDSEGRLVGIASQIVRSMPNEAMFIHPRTIRTFLDQNEVGYTIFL